jgi:hypothetical protein
MPSESLRAEPPPKMPAPANAPRVKSDSKPTVTRWTIAEAAREEARRALADGRTARPPRLGAAVDHDRARVVLALDADEGVAAGLVDPGAGEKAAAPAAGLRDEREGGDARRARELAARRASGSRGTRL